MPRKKPKHNPKLDKPSDGRRKDSIQSDLDLYEEQRYYSRFYMIIVFIGIVAVITVLVFVVFDVGGLRIKKYDLVKLDYEIYSYADYQDLKEPTIKETGTWVNVTSIYDENANGTLIKGFYNELLGNKVGGFLSYQLIVKCRDFDKDGYNDDYPEQEALSYGFPINHSLYYTDIVLYFKVIEINASLSVETQVSNKLQSFRESTFSIYFFNHPLVYKRKYLMIL